MIHKGLFSQIAMIVLSFVIVFMYVKPEFAKIGEIQDSITVYQTELEKVEGVNNELKRLVSLKDSVDQVEQRKLLVYMPDSVDGLNVMRDIAIIYDLAGFDQVVVAYDGFESENNMVKTSADNNSIYSVEVKGTYEQIKKLFDLLETNHYPLEVTNLDISTLEESDLLDIKTEFVTYSYVEPELTNKVEF